MTRIGLMAPGILSLAVAVSVQAQMPLPGPIPVERWKDELKLEENQILQIQDIQYASRRDEIDRRAELERAQLELDRAMERDDPDEATVLRLFDAVHDARGELERLHLRMRLRIKVVLTEEQEAALARLIHKRERTPRPGPRAPR